MRWTLISVVLLGLILVPFFLFEDYFNALAASLADGEGATWYAALAFSALLASDVVLPIPSSLVSAAAGVVLGFAGGTLVIWTGMMVSCVLGYWIGARSSHAARRFVGEQGLARAAGIAEHYGRFAVVICRPIPVLAEASTVFAGLVQAPLQPFLWASALSNLGVAMGYAAVGAFSMRVESFFAAFLGAIVLPGIGMLAAKVWLDKGR